MSLRLRGTLRWLALGTSLLAVAGEALAVGTPQSPFDYDSVEDAAETIQELLGVVSVEGGFFLWQWARSTAFGLMTIELVYWVIKHCVIGGASLRGDGWLGLSNIGGLLVKKMLVFLFLWTMLLVWYAPFSTWVPHVSYFMEHGEAMAEMATYSVDPDHESPDFDIDLLLGRALYMFALQGNAFLVLSVFDIEQWVVVLIVLICMFVTLASMTAIAVQGLYIYGAGLVGAGIGPIFFVWIFSRWSSDVAVGYLRFMAHLSVRAFMYLTFMSMYDDLYTLWVQWALVGVQGGIANAAGASVVIALSTVVFSVLVLRMPGEIANYVIPSSLTFGLTEGVKSDD